MQAKVNWHKRLTFTGTADSGFTVPLGARPEVGGDNDGFRPMELISIGLAGCTAMDVISLLQKMRQEVTNFEVLIHAIQADKHPKVFTHINIEYRVTGSGINETSLLRAIELSTERYCPAQGMLAQVVPIELKYHIYEANSSSEPKLVTSGAYNPPEG
jgi:putative redox protein